MHTSFADKVFLTVLFLAVACLPASYVWTAVRALRTGHLKMTARGIRLSVLRSEKPKRFAFSVWGLILFMTPLAMLCLGFAVLVVMAR